MQNEIHKQSLLHFIVKNNGVIELPKTLFPNFWDIKKITAVYFDEEFKDDGNTMAWNEYVGRVRSARSEEHTSELQSPTP